MKSPSNKTHVEHSAGIASTQEGVQSSLGFAATVNHPGLALPESTSTAYWAFLFSLILLAAEGNVRLCPETY
jgi:hypothetical protein